MAQLVRLQSPATSSSFASVSAGARLATTLARCLQTASTSVRRGWRPPWWKCLGEIIQLANTQESWLCAQVCIKKGGLGIRDTGLHSLAAFLASSSSTASLCNSLWAEYNDTHDPDVATTETQFQRTVHEDAAKHPGSSGHSQSFASIYLSDLCHVHTLDAPVTQATGSPAESTRSWEREPGL